MRIEGNETGILNSRLSRFSFIVTIAALALQIGLILISFGKLPPKIPVFYSLPWGDAVLSSATVIWIIPILNAVFCAFDFFLISRVRDDAFLSRILASLVILVCFGCFYATVKIISLLI